MTQKRKYQLISEIENWTLPFFKASSGFCPLYSPSIFESGAALSHGLNLSEERKYRILIIKYMFEAGDNLLLPYNTICIGITYFHKFFQSISIRAHDPYYISTSCLFTAGKQEETRIRLDKCARFLYDYKLNNSNNKTNANTNTNTTTNKPYQPPNKHDIERICKKLAIAELLCTQINKFNYNINLPFDYLLPIISQWKSVYIPHQTNLKTLKYIYCLNAFKFIKESFYIPINIMIPPQKIAIVCMELSLRLNYNKYQLQQEQINNGDSSPDKDKTTNEYRYIDPPLQWFRIFDIDSNEQDLKDEINLITNEIINSIQNYKQFGIENATIGKKILSHWRRGSLKIDVVHQQLIDRQLKHNNIQFENNYYYASDRDRTDIKNNKLFAGTELMQHPYNYSNDLSINDLLNNDNKKVLKHRYKIQKQVELSLAFNNQTISPASLNPHQFFTLYPLKDKCFADVDNQYKIKIEKEKQLEKQKILKHKRNRKTKKKHKKYSSDDSSDSDKEKDINESKSNAIKEKNKNKKRDDRKRKRSESIDKENHRKKRRIERSKKQIKNSNSDGSSSGSGSGGDSSSSSDSNSSDNHKNNIKLKRKHKTHRDRNRKRSRSSSTDRHSKDRHREGRDRDRDRDRRRGKRSRSRDKSKSKSKSKSSTSKSRGRSRSSSSSSSSSSSHSDSHSRKKRNKSSDKNRRDRSDRKKSRKRSDKYNRSDRYKRSDRHGDKRDKRNDRNSDRKKKNIQPRYEGGYFTPDPRDKRNRNENNNRNRNRGMNNRYNQNKRGGNGNNNRRRGGMNNINMGVMGMNIGSVNGYYGGGADDVFDVKDTNLQSFDYGLTPNNGGNGNGGGGGKGNNGNGDDEQVNDDQLRQVLMIGGNGNGNSREFNEEKTQRNNEPVSPLLKALRSNKSALYTNMIIPSRREDQ